ncbi:MAG: hypothetical protein O3A00_02570 [Planctomycetota bacterium]|nr:hypothetical protein [Planctomycetota bacterium]
MSDETSLNLNVNPDSTPVQVPVFNCVVYLSTHDGKVTARVANLAGLELIGSDERDALSRVVSAFKNHVRSLMESKSEIPWVEPIPGPESNESRRFIPVHL